MGRTILIGKKLRKIQRLWCPAQARGKISWREYSIPRLYALPKPSFLPVIICRLGYFPIKLDTIFWVPSGELSYTTRPCRSWDLILVDCENIPEMTITTFSASLYVGSITHAFFIIIIFSLKLYLTSPARLVFASLKFHLLPILSASLVKRSFYSTHTHLS